MSKSQASAFEVLKAAAGFGKGAYKGDHKQSKEDDSKFIDEMYSKRDDNIQLRQGNAQKFVDSFYNIATDFYEQGWGQCFHFAPRGNNETFREAIVRHEHYLALKLGIQPDDVVLDIGCGIGGPMRNIAQFTGSKIVGVTINEYQVQRGNEINKAEGVEERCLLKQGDFCKLSQFEDNSVDKVFAIESTCHSPNRCAVYDQVYRVLKPGGKFASYEWVLNEDTFDPQNEDHLTLKYEIEKGNALPNLITDKAVLGFFEQSGFEVVYTEDVDKSSRAKGQIPWHTSLMAKCTLENFQHTVVGMAFTHYLTWFLETINLAPKGTFRTHGILRLARDGLVKGGENQTFTPMFFVMGQKPMEKDI